VSDDDYPSLVAEVMGYFGSRPPRRCVTCGMRPEARPGVRLCVTCLRIAATCYEAISRESEAGRG
jgi:hypothetical protein